MDSRPIVLFGRNGAGKTNVLEAVSLLTPGRGLRRAAADVMARKPEGLGWKVSAEINSLGHEHEVATWAETDRARQVLIDGKAAPQLALGNLMRMAWLVPSMDRLWTEGADGRRRFLDRLTLGFEPQHGALTLAYDKAMRERNRLLRDRVHDDSWYGALEFQMARAGAQISTNRLMAIDLLTAAQQQADTTFPVADLTLENRDGGAGNTTVEEDLLAAISAGRTNDLTSGRTGTGPHRADLGAVYVAKGVSAAACSTGEQKALLVSLVLAGSRALKASFGAAPILLLDELAAHLDSDRRAALYDEILSLKTQAWMTGTGIELFDSFGDKAQYLEVCDDGGLSLVKKR